MRLDWLLETNVVICRWILMVGLVLSTTLEECTYIVNGSDTFGGDDQSLHDLTDLSEPCVLSNTVDKAMNWYGYIGRFKMRAHGAKFYYNISYPEEDCCIKILLYLEPQVDMLRYHMSCLQMQSVLDPTSPQVITLSPNSPSSGCRTNVTSSGQRIIDCFSGRILTSDIERKWYIAVSSCGSPDGLRFRYSLYIYGWVNDPDDDDWVHDPDTESDNKPDCPASEYMIDSAPRLQHCLSSPSIFVVMVTLLWITHIQT